MEIIAHVFVISLIFTLLSIFYVQYIASLARALIYCHQKHVIHRDIKPENLLIGIKVVIIKTDYFLCLYLNWRSLAYGVLMFDGCFCQGELKIADFGWSVHTFNKRKTFCGTLDYLAPEMGMCILSTWNLTVTLYHWQFVKN